MTVFQISKVVIHPLNSISTAITRYCHLHCAGFMGPHTTFCVIFVCVSGAFNLKARQREGPADLRGQRGLHPAPLRLPTGHPRLGEEHAGALREGQPGVQIQGQEVGAALCRSVSPTGVPRNDEGVLSSATRIFFVRAQAKPAAESLE